MKLIFATNNSNKIREIGALLGGDFEVSGLSEEGITEDIPEEYETLEENAAFKAEFVFLKTGKNVFADDTGLEIDSLGGKPGVHSARFAGTARDFEANIDKVLEMMGNTENRAARFRTVIALIVGGEKHLFEGIVEGKIIKERRGTGGFGYDPVFVPDGFEKSFAEMTLEEKNQVSHRARAFKKMVAYLCTVPGKQ